MNIKLIKYANKRLFIIVPILVVIMLIFIQCNKKMCTCNIAYVILTLKYPDEQPVLLDSGKVLRVSNNQILYSWNGGVSVTGDCLIVDDDMQKELENKKEIMRITAYLNGKIVCERDVLVSADHCHVKYLGKEPLTHVVYGIPDDVRDRKFCEMVNVENIKWIFISYNAFRSTIDKELPFENKLDLIVDWLLSHSCITDAHVDGIYLTSEINGDIVFSFVENGEIIRMVMRVKNKEMIFGGFIS